MTGRALDNKGGVPKSARQTLDCDGGTADQIGNIDPIGQREAVDVECEPAPGDIDKRRR